LGRHQERGGVRVEVECLDGDAAMALLRAAAPGEAVECHSPTC
jgi:hypothetical protein